MQVILVEHGDDDGMEADVFLTRESCGDYLVDELEFCDDEQLDRAFDEGKYDNNEILIKVYKTYRVT